MKWFLTMFLLAAATVLVPRSAGATEPEITLQSSEDRVVLEVEGWSAKDVTPRFRRGHLEVFLESGPTYMQVAQIDDPTIKRAALVGGQKPRLIVVVAGDRQRVAGLTTLSTIEPRENGFRLIVPRALPTPAPAEPAVAPMNAAPSHVDSVQAPAAAEVAPVAASTEVQSPAPAVPEPLPTSDPAEAKSPTAPSNSTPSIGWTGVVFLMLAAGLAIFAWKKKNDIRHDVPAPFRIVASQAMGNRARVALLAAGGRRMLVGLSERGVTLLDRWEETAEPSHDDEALAFAAADLTRRWQTQDHQGPAPKGAVVELERASTPAAVVHTSPAVAGLMRLRQNLGYNSSPLNTGRDEILQ